MNSTVILVAYHGDQWLPNCLHSLPLASSARLHLVLIDNSLAFKTYTKVLKTLAEARGATRARFWVVEYDEDRERYPTSYRDALVEKLKAMTEKDLKKVVGRYIDKTERKFVLDRRDVILQQIRELQGQ